MKTTTAPATGKACSVTGDGGEATMENPAGRLSTRGQAWFCSTGLPSDVVIEIDGIPFNLHKFPLMSKSRKIHRLLTERVEQQRRRLPETGELPAPEEESPPYYLDEDLPAISLPGFPGGTETFESAARFCYGAKVELTAGNAAPLRCAAEYLEMTEDFAEENLVPRTDRFLSPSMILRWSIADSVTALKSCEALSPMAEDLGLVQRCIDAIAARACSSSSSDFAATDSKQLSGAMTKSSGNDGVVGRRKVAGIRTSVAGDDDDWFEELTVLSLPIYKRVIAAIRSRDPTPEAIEGCLISYAKRSIPGLSRSGRKNAAGAAVTAAVATEAEQRELLETVIASLPAAASSEKQGSGGGLVTARFLFGLLRTVNILRAGDASRSAIEQRIAGQLEKAALDDLLIPSYSYLAETLYDVECVERIVGYFMEGGGGVGAGDALLAVGRLIDGYLAEIASDANLDAGKFCDVALALPDQARLFDDGLYRAVDIYLKAHPELGEKEMERVCGVMDCQKLTLEACSHAAQNDRLPLRAVVQVLFFEQLQLRRAVAGTIMASDGAVAGGLVGGAQTPPMAAWCWWESSVDGGDEEHGEGWRASTVRENRVMRLDMDSMRSRVGELELECARMKKALEKMGRKPPPAVMAAVTAAARPGGGMGLGSLARRIGCSRVGTQVRDTRDRTAVDSRKDSAARYSP